MRIFRRKEDSLRFGLSLFLILGSVLGSYFCNGMSDEMKYKLLEGELQNWLRQSGSESSEINAGIRMISMLPILTKRLWTLAILLLAATSPMKRWLMRLAAGGAGFSCAVAVCVMTMNYGMLGIVYFVLSVIPQGISYGMAAYLLLWQIAGRERELKMAEAAVLAAMITVGAVLESYAAPWLGSWFY